MEHLLEFNEFKALNEKKVTKGKREYVENKIVYINRTNHSSFSDDVYISESRKIKSRRIGPGQYEIIDKKTKEVLGQVMHNNETNMWDVIDADGRGQDTTDTKAEAMGAFTL